MADLREAFNVLKFQKKTFQNIDYFFTQRKLIEETEYIDKNMNLKMKKNKVTHNFLALNIPLNIIPAKNWEQNKLDKHHLNLVKNESLRCNLSNYIQPKELYSLRSEKLIEDIHQEHNFCSRSKFSLDNLNIRENSNISEGNEIAFNNTSNIIKPLNENSQNNSIEVIKPLSNTYETPIGFDIEIFGDEGYHYKGTITSYDGIVPNFMIPIKGDKKIFVHINYKFLDINNNNYLFKKYISFIEVPKRYQLNPNVSD